MEVYGTILARVNFIHFHKKSYLTSISSSSMKRFKILQQKRHQKCIQQKRMQQNAREMIGFF